MVEFWFHCEPYVRITGVDKVVKASNFAENKQKKSNLHNGGKRVFLTCNVPWKDWLKKEQGENPCKHHTYEFSFLFKILIPLDKNRAVFVNF